MNKKKQKNFIHWHPQRAHPPVPVIGNEVKRSRKRGVILTSACLNPCAQEMLQGHASALSLQTAKPLEPLLGTLLASLQKMKNDVLVMRARYSQNHAHFCLAFGALIVIDGFFLFLLCLISVTMPEVGLVHMGG